MAYFFLLVLFMCSSAYTQGQLPFVCSDVQQGSDAPPINLGTDFSMRMEIVSQESNRVTNIRMFYSGSQNKIRLQMLDSSVRSDMYFHFADNEILTFDYSSGRGVCTITSDLANAADTLIVGGSKDNKIPRPLAVLHLIGQSGSKIQLKYIGEREDRGMAVTEYYSCQNMTFGNQSAIVNVSHFFSSKDWARPAPDNIPVKIEIHGSAFIHDKVVSIDHWYNFFDVQSGASPQWTEVFETPPGIMCLGRNVDLPFPNLAGYIKFSGETLNPTKSQVIYFEEIYDADDDFVVFRSQSPLNYGTQGGMNEITVIRDYPSGLSYQIDNTIRLCTIQNITAANPLPFDFINSQGKVQEITPEQLFFKTGDKYVYLGERNVRGMLTDIWITKTNIPSFPNNEVTVEWYFAKPDVTSWNSNSDYYKKGQYRMPVLLRVWPDDITLASEDTNIYHVDYTNIMYGVLDIRDCYPERQSNYFQIILNGAQELIVNTNIDQFKWSAAMSIAKVAGVRWIRIADLQVYYDVGDAVIEFELLDAPPYASDVAIPINEISLQQATQNLVNAVTGGAMFINVYDSATNQISKPIRVSSNVKVAANNASPVPSQDDGYSAGAMAGLGLAMVVIGGAGGGIGAHFIIK